MPPSDHGLLRHDNNARSDDEPRQRSTAAAAAAAQSQPRTRSAAELQQHVLALVRATRPRAPVTDRVTTRYESFRVACTAWVTSAFARAQSKSRTSLTSALPRAECQSEHGHAVSTLLRELAQSARTERRALVAAVAHSLRTTAHVVDVKRRKRRLPSAIAHAVAAAAAACGRHDKSDGDAAAANSALRRVAELLGVWLLHSAGLLRLEDVLLDVARTSADPADAWTWLAVPVHTLLAQPAQRVVLPATDAPSDASTTTTTTTTSHAIVECVLLYLIRLAFSDAAADAPFARDASVNPRSSAVERAAAHALDTLCAFTSASFSVPALQRVTRLLAARTETHPVSSSSGSSRRFGPMVVARDRVAAFLQPQLARLVAPASRAHSRFGHDELAQVLQAYEACLPASALVQIIRQSVYEATHGRSSELPGAVAMDSADAVNGPTPVVAGALHELIASAASRARDHLQDDFTSHVLTLAHELASDGAQTMRGELVRHALELVAAVASARRSDCYRDWVRDHFGAHDESDAKRQRADSASGGAAASASARPAPPPSAASCRKPLTTCRLITSKRQIQFLCAFLLEFDRRDTSARPGDGAPQRPVAQAEHVAAHLSAMKTHQAQFPTGGLIMDFCSQTRSRYLELLQREQAAVSDPQRTRAAESSSGAPSTHSLKVRAMVREHIALHRETHKLSPQLRQWKLFQPKLWKHELIPCCLDLAFDGDSATSSSAAESASTESQLLAHVAFVHALAKSGLVAVAEYAQFVTRAEARLSDWQQQTRLETHPRHKRQRSDPARGDALERALERLQLERQRHDSQSRRPALADATLRTLQDALVATLLDANTVESAGSSPSETTASRPWTQRMWDNVCVRVPDAMGLDCIDAFFASVVPALRRSAQSRRQATLLAVAGDSDSNRSEALEASVAAVGLAQVAMPRQSSSVDASFVRDVSCLAALTASLVGQLSVAGASPHALLDVVELITQIDAACVGAATDSSRPPQEASDRAAESRVPHQHDTIYAHDYVLRRSLFVALTLRALVALPLEARNVTLLLESEALGAHVRAFIAWLGYRSVAPRAFALSDEDETPRTHEAAHDTPRSMLCASLQVLARMEWFRDVFDLNAITTRRLERIVSLELRYGRVLFCKEHEDGAGASRSALGAWLQLELDVLEDFGSFRLASAEAVVEWIVTEFLAQVTTASASASSSASPHGSEDIRDAVHRSIDDTIALLLLLLNDMMHRLSAESLAAAAAAPARPTTLSPLDRVLVFFLDAVASRMTPSQHSPPLDQVFPANRALQHHGFEVFEVIVRHHERHASSRLLLSGDVHSCERLVDLLRVVGAHFHDHFPPSLLRAVSDAIACVLRAPCASASDTPARVIRDLPLAVVARCGLAFPRLRATLEDRTRTPSSAERRLQAFVAHLAWLHRFANCIARGDHSSNGDEQDRALDAREPLVSPAFESRTEQLEYALALVKLFVRWRVLAVPDALAQPRVELERFYAEAAGRILRAWSAAECRDSSAPMALPELATAFAREWQATASDAHVQLLLVHAVALLCARSATVAKTLLRSWRPASSSPSLTSSGDSAALFLVLVAIALRGADGEQLQRAVRSSSSVWLNEFPRVALHVHATAATSTAALPSTCESTELEAMASVVASTQRFRDALERVLRDVLELSVALHVDVLDAALPRRISEAWPSLRSTAAKLHVLVPLDESSAF